MSHISRQTGFRPRPAMNAPWAEHTDVCVLFRLGLDGSGALTPESQKKGLPVLAREDPLYNLSLLVRLLREPVAAVYEETVRLSSLVHYFVDMDIAEASLLMKLAEPQTHDFVRTPQAFHMVLMEVISSQRLHRLFTCGQSGEYHRGIVPGGYSERTGEIFPHEMAAWRADFRAMAPEQQMLAATIVWLYQSGADSTWLRRVPCTWSVVEGVQYMRDAGCLGDWLRLLALCPGW